MWTSGRYSGLECHDSDRSSSFEDSGTENYPEYPDDDRRNVRSGRGRREAEEFQIEELPIHAFREEILEHVRTNRVTCIQGETGCGKSTKVPQFILEDAIARNVREVNIVVTQPRRIACVALAERVATEMNEEVGVTVGYRIAREAEVSPSTKLTFMTTGFLLQLLINHPSSLDQFSHIILDEVHERNLDADLLSLVVKLQSAAMASRTRSSSFKIVIMSATMQGNLFSQYFVADGAEIPPTISVGAKRFNVDTLYLDDLLWRPDGGPNWEEKSKEGDLMKSISLKSPLVAEILKTNRASKFVLDARAESAVRNSCIRFQPARQGGSGTTARPLKPEVLKDLDFVLLDLIRQLAVAGESILVFLPGIGDMTTVYETIAKLEAPESKKQTPARTFKVFLLHSEIATEEQDDVRKEPAPDAVHVILSTNIAESSLTLPKVRVVIDFCLRRHMTYRAGTHTSFLVNSWAAHSSCQQRLGRTGRVFPGVCIRLVTREHFDKRMDEFDAPEIVTAPLDRVYLQTKNLGTLLNRSFSPAAAAMVGAKPSKVAGKTFTTSQLWEMSVQPPPQEHIQRAKTSLHQIGAMTGPFESSKITTLGQIAMHLPLDVRLSRLIYFSIALGLPVEGVIIAACTTVGDPFTLPIHLIIPSPVDYGEALQRSLYTRDHFDKKSYSEPLMCRNMFIEWLKYFQERTKAIKAKRPGNSRLGLSKSARSFTKQHSVVRKKLTHLITSVVDIATRVKRLLHSVACQSAVRGLDVLLGLMEGNVDEGLEISSVLCDNPLFLKSLICISLAPQFILGRPQVALPATSTSISLPSDLKRITGYSITDNPTKDSVEGKRELGPLEAIAKRGVDPSRCFVIPDFPWQLGKRFLFSSLRLMIPYIRTDATVFGSFAIVSFPLKDLKQQPHQMNDWTDLPIEAHLLNQFGGPRRKFPAPIPIDYKLPDLPFPQGWESKNAFGARNALANYSEFYKQNVLLSQPQNPCLVKWRVLGFWSAEELRELQHGRGGDADTTKTTMFKFNNPIEVEGKCNNRNPIGFLATFPRSFRNSELTPSRAHELLVGTFVTQEGSAKFNRLDGVTLLPQAVALKLILACVRQTFDMRWVVESHGIDGAKISSLGLTNSRQTIPVSLQIGSNEQDLSKNVSLPLQISDLLKVNRFRNALSAFWEESENRAAKAEPRIDFNKSASEDSRIPEADACVFVDKDVRLITALTDLLSSSPAEPPSPNELFELLGTKSIGEFLEDMSPLSPESYNSCGRLLESKLGRMGTDSIKSEETPPVFSSTPTTASRFMRPVSIAGVTAATSKLRKRVLGKQEPPSPGKDKKKPPQLKLIDRAIAQGLSPPTHLGKEAQSFPSMDSTTSKAKRKAFKMKCEFPDCSS